MYVFKYNYILIHFN